MSKGGKGLTTLTNLNTRETIAKLSKVAEGTVHKVKFIEDKADEETKANQIRKPESVRLKSDEQIDTIGKIAKEKEKTHTKEGYQKSLRIDLSFFHN